MCRFVAIRRDDRWQVNRCVTSIHLKHIATSTKDIKLWVGHLNCPRGFSVSWSAKILYGWSNQVTSRDTLLEMLICVGSCTLTRCKRLEKQARESIWKIDCDDMQTTTYELFSQSSQVSCYCLSCVCLIGYTWHFSYFECDHCCHAAAASGDRLYQPTVHYQSARMFCIERMVLH